MRTNRTQESLGVAVSRVVEITLIKPDKFNLSEEQIHRSATHIVIGRVASIYQRATTNRRRRYTCYVAEVQVCECWEISRHGREWKDPVFQQGATIYVRYWQRTRERKGPSKLNSRDDCGLPDEGETCRIYVARLARRDFTGNNHKVGMEVKGRNGFEKMDPKLGQ